MSGTFGTIGGSSGGSSQDVEFAILCDSNAGTIIRFLRKFISTGGVITHADTQLDGATAYTPSGTVTDCDGTYTVTDECLTVIFDGAGFTSGDRLLRITAWDLTQTPAAILSQTYFNMNAGAALAAPPTLIWLRPCDSEFVTYSACYKALTATAYFDPGDTIIMTRVEDYTNVGASQTTDILYYNVSRGASSWSTNAFVPMVGTDITPCKQHADALAVHLLCDSTGARFLRFFVRDDTGGVTTQDTALDGVTGFVPVAPISDCSASAPPDNELEILCDVAADGTATRFLRRYTITNGGVTTQDTALDGTTAYTVVGTVGVCVQTKKCFTCR